MKRLTILPSGKVVYADGTPLGTPSRRGHPDEYIAAMRNIYINGVRNQDGSLLTLEERCLFWEELERLLLRACFGGRRELYAG